MKKITFLSLAILLLANLCLATESQTGEFDQSSFVEKLSRYSDPKEQESFTLKQIDEFPNEAKLYIVLGSIYSNWAKQEPSKYYDAETSYKKALTIKPDDLGAMNGLGSVYFGLKQYANAEEEFKKIVSIDPNFAPVYVNYGMLKAHTREFQDAIKYFKKAISLDPMLDRIDFVHNYLGDCNGWLKLNDEAILEYEKACDLNSNNIRPHLNLGSLYCMKAMSNNDLSLLDKGEEHFKMTLQLSPDNAEAKQGLKNAEQARLKIESQSKIMVKTSGNTVIVFPSQYEKQAEGLKTELDKLKSKDKVSN